MVTSHIVSSLNTRTSYKPGHSVYIWCLSMSHKWPVNVSLSIVPDKRYNKCPIVRGLISRGVLCSGVISPSRSGALCCGVRRTKSLSIRFEGHSLNQRDAIVGACEEV